MGASGERREPTRRHRGAPAAFAQVVDLTGTIVVTHK
jgi:hypothetical protein